MGHEAHNGEDDEACEHAGARVDAADNDGVPAEKEGGCQGGHWQEGELVDVMMWEDRPKTPIPREGKKP